MSPYYHNYYFSFKLRYSLFLTLLTFLVLQKYTFIFSECIFHLVSSSQGFGEVVYRNALSHTKRQLIGKHTTLKQTYHKQSHYETC